MNHQCRKCGSVTRRLDIEGSGGGALFLPFSPEFEATLDADFTYDGDEPAWLCRFIDADTCTACDATDLALHDPTTFMHCDGRHLPRSPLLCVACGSSCVGPIDIECYGVPGRPMAYLAHKFGAPLVSRLCERCGRVWLSLYPDDQEARRELAARIADNGSCERCGRGRLRVTSVDVPYSGLAGLYDPAAATGHLGTTGLEADLFIAVCDSCGEAEAKARWLRHKPA